MRILGWESLLNEHITQAHRSPFVWGKTDCVLWCADWVKKATGVDHARGWRGKYKTKTGADKLLQKHGFKDVAAITDAHLNAIPVLLAKRGDIVLAEQGCLGICNGVYSFFLTKDSVTRLPTKSCLKAWEVG